MLLENDYEIREDSVGEEYNIVDANEAEFDLLARSIKTVRGLNWGLDSGLYEDLAYESLLFIATVGEASQKRWACVVVSRWVSSVVGHWRTVYGSVKWLSEQPTDVNLTEFLTTDKNMESAIVPIDLLEAEITQDSTEAYLSFDSLVVCPDVAKRYFGNVPEILSR